MIYKLMITTKDPAELRELLSKIEGQTTGPAIVGEVEVKTVEQAVQPVETGTSTTLTPVASHTQVPAGVTVDVTGVPWNPEIHSSSKKFNADGSWKRKKNFGKETTVATQPEPAVTYVAPPTPTVEVARPTTTVEPAIVQPRPVEPVAAQPVYAAIPTLPQSTERPALDYAAFKNDLPMVMTRLISSGQVKQTYVDELNKYFGIQQIWQVIGDERKCMELFDVLCKQGFITKIGIYPPSVPHTATGEQLTGAMNGVQ